MQISGLGLAASGTAAVLSSYPIQQRVPHPVLHPVLQDFVDIRGLRGLGVAQILDQGTVEAIAAAIQQQEGYYPGSLAYKNNNPGNLIYVGQYGAVSGEGGFAKFASYQDGLQALYNQIQLYASRGLTIQGMMDIYAPAGHGTNDPYLYASNVAAAVGSTPDTLLTDIGQVYPSDFPENISASAGQINPGMLAGVILAGLVGVLALSNS